MAQQPKTNKSKAIRDYLVANPQASSADVVAALVPQGIAVTVGTVNDVKYRLRKSRESSPAIPGKSRGTGTKPGSTPTSTLSTRRTGRVERAFPRVTLEDALKIAMAIRHKNGGNPWNPNEVAKALDRRPRTSSFFYLTAASRDFGLTTGTRDSAEIALTELGRRLAYAETPEEELSTRREAFFKVDLFRQVLDYYKGSNLPEMKFLHNTLENKFGLAPTLHDEFAELFRKNCEYLEIREGAESTASAAGVPEKSGNVPTGGGGPDFVTVAEPETDTGRTCFVAMPFSERDPKHAEGFFAEVLKQIIAPAGRKAGFRVVTARKKGSDVIHATIMNGLLDADLVIADLTEHNPNVLFELGMRMAEDKPVALIRAAGTTAIFDVDNMLRVEEYNPCLWPSTVENDIPKIAEHIQGAWENRGSGQTYMRILRSKRESPSRD